MQEFVCKKENPTFAAQKPVKCFLIIGGLVVTFFDYFLGR
jgi:hypothetical protein